MVMPGLINLDFADIRAVMSEMGKAMMGTGEAEGDRRAIDAAEAAISNPLLDDVSMKGARGVLINITGGLDMTLFEVDEAANRIREEVDPDANIIFGSTFDEKLDGRMRISVVATGIDLDGAREPRPVISLVSDRSRDAAPGKPGSAPAAKPEPAAAPALAQALAPVPPPQPAAEPDLPQVVAAERAAVDKGGFVPPTPVEPPAPRPIVMPPPMPVAPPAPAPQRAAEAARPAAKPQEPHAEPVRARHQRRPPHPARGGARDAHGSHRPRPPQPRLGAPDPADRISAANREEDLLDIPAFLRRQAN